MLSFNRNNIHKKTPSIASGYFVQSDRNDSEHSLSFIPSAAHHSEHKSSQITFPSLDFLPESPNIVIESSSNYSSLLCCITKSSTIKIPTYYICKPATREWRKMPNPKTRLTALHTGVAVTQTYPNLQFKMLRLSYTKTGFGHHCEVFDSTSWAWKRLAYIKFNIEGTMLRKRNGIFLNGGFHWLTNLGEIFVYHVDQEKWAIIKVTQEMENYIQEALCIAIYCDGKLGVLYTTKEWMEIWILEGYSTTNPIWKRKFRRDVRRIFENSRYHPWPVGMWSNDTVMMLCDTKVVWINCTNDTCTTSEFSKPSTHELYLFRTEFLVIFRRLLLGRHTPLDGLHFAL
ncbi:F-box protein At5g49610-like [Papaver somniferum]|uniref:F-box protein At5g49610-like n=1 Tax=Papaver somniferum TaxID=3469 RepID=UPI000E7052A8|nr:F-box protein At5g49610-like [Papaver somniferum]